MSTLNGGRTAPLESSLTPVGHRTEIHRNVDVFGRLHNNILDEVSGGCVRPAAL
jgi:hypothetical protein